MFRTYYVHLQEDCIVHAALYGMFQMRLDKQSSKLKYVFEHKRMEHIPYYNNNNNNYYYYYYYYYYLLQLGCHPVAVVTLHVYKIRN